jgi:DNA polymerase-3 subunit beta
MKISISRDAFQECLSSANRAGSRGAGAVRLEVAKDKVSVTGTDGDISLTVDVQATADDTGTVLVPGRYLQQLVSAIPAASVSLEVLPTSVIVTGGASKFTVERFPDATVFPVISAPTADPVAVSGDLIGALAIISTSAAKEKTAPSLTGVCMTATDGNVELAATDKYRVSRLRMQAEGLVTASAIIPTAAIDALARVMAKRGAISVSFDATSVSFSAAGAVLTTRLLVGSFPAYNSVIPAVPTELGSNDTHVSIATDVLVDALSRARLVNDKRVTIAMASDVLDISAQSDSGSSSGSEPVPATVTGADVTVKVNPAYLVEMLRSVPSETVEITITGAKQIMRIDPVGGLDVTHVVMPLRA